ncbi:MAG: zinc ribbon domain-containing protein [Acidobacteriaceae bacterium]|nr:zinc ribbon domain-containing protein [Acidobacteriaceae bacterium]
MPLYEYKCKKCKKHTEKIQKFSDAEITECPHCAGPLERVVTAAAFSLKGGGWYKDGYSSHVKHKSSSDHSTSSPSAASSSSSATPAPASAPAPAAATAAKK